MPLLKLKNASYPDPERLELVNEYDLGRDGSKWRHGWIPLNAQATAIKAKKPVGHSGGSGEVKSAGHAVRSAPEKETFKGVATETHRGNTISVRRGKQYGSMETRINGKSLGSHAGLSNKDAARHLDSAKGTIDDFHKRPSAYTNGNGDVSYGMKRESGSSVGKSRLSTSTVRPSRLKLKGDKGRASSNPFQRAVDRGDIKPTGREHIGGGVHGEAAAKLTPGNASEHSVGDKVKVPVPSKNGMVLAPGTVTGKETRKSTGSTRFTVTTDHDKQERYYGKESIRKSEPTPAPKKTSYSELLKTSTASHQAHADSLAVHQTSKGTGVLNEPGSKQERTLKLQQAAQDRTRANINRERAKDEAAGFDKMSVAELAELSHHNGAAHAELQRRLNGSDPAKVPVYNTETGKVEHVSPAEATAGHVRYGQSLGAGSAAAGQTVKNALEAEKARRAANDLTGRDPRTMSEAEKTRAAEQMFGTDRSKWSVANLKSAAKAGDSASQTELARRANAKAKTAPKLKRNTSNGLSSTASAAAARRAELDRDKPGFGASSSIGRQSPSADRVGAEAARLSANARANEAARQSPARDALMAKRLAVKAEMAQLPSGSARKAALARQLTTINRKLAP